MKRVGVTGAAGFVGSHVCELLLDRDVEVAAVDDLSYGWSRTSRRSWTTSASRSTPSTARANESCAAPSQGAT